jgi:predicted transcriptional regulator
MKNILKNITEPNTPTNGKAARQIPLNKKIFNFSSISSTTCRSVDERETIRTFDS